MLNPEPEEELNPELTKDESWTDLLREDGFWTGLLRKDGSWTDLLIEDGYCEIWLVGAEVLLVFPLLGVGEPRVLLSSKVPGEEVEVFNPETGCKDSGARTWDLRLWLKPLGGSTWDDDLNYEGLIIRLEAWELFFIHIHNIKLW